MVFKILSKEDWELEGFVGEFSVGMDDWFSGVDQISVNDWDSINDWGEGDGVLISDAFFWEEGILLYGG